MRAAEPTPRRGVTLVEMLVVVALVVLMMVILVSIFGAATGAISVSRTYQELDNNLRMLDQTIRTDLTGATARFTPPLDPKDKLGYFEYGENSFADLQGEDTDDYIAFTTKAPEGRYFSGRIWVPEPNSTAITNPQILAYRAKMPIVATSQFAEVIYYLRNGNLYRRVFLVVPERRASLKAGTISAGVAGSNYPGQLFGLNGLNVSWQGMNDISCRPSDAATGSGAVPPPIPNDLGDLTDRHNRAFRPRFMNDYVDTRTGGYPAGQDGSADDNNGDDIPDFHPNLYPNLLTNGFGVLHNERAPYNMAPQRVTPTGSIYGPYAFPHINPGMYSRPDTTPLNTANGNNTPNDTLGWLHAPDPSGVTRNHSPLETGDSLTIPNAPASAQTWFGFPTWRETMTGYRSAALLGWLDPILAVNQSPYNQPPGLQPFAPNVLPAATSINFPPPTRVPFALKAEFGIDNAGSLNFVPALPTNLPTLGTAANNYNDATNPLQGLVWEDDLIMTGVRSFDVKAYDPDATVYNRLNVNPAVTYAAGYHDLGFASAPDTTGVSFFAAGYPSSLMRTDTVTTRTQAIPVLPFFPLQDANFNPVGFGHEGRIPPLINDNRVNPSRPYRKNVSANGFIEPNNLGDDAASVIRLRRVYDTWSTTYTNAPSVDKDYNGSPLQSYPNDLPVYPSYPAPYPAPLRGIQIQIRVVDPRNERIKVLTIRQDFSDKL